MAWFRYECKTHGAFKKSLQKREKTIPCNHCGAACLPLLKEGTVSVVDRLDNGVMVRAVERLHNIEEIMEERADRHTKQVTGGDESDDV
ncbi:MAG: hypothetical protein ACREGB_02295 [Candidatus Saccharimonadales bacterium]